MKPRTIYSFFQAVLALIGAGIAGFIYREHMAGLSIPCFTGGGCDIVNASHWAYLFGIPVSLIGAVAYMVLLFAAVIKLTSESDKLYSWLSWFMMVTTGCGFITSWIFQYIAKYLIGAFCIWCRASAITMTLLFMVSIIDVVMTAKAARQGVPTRDLQIDNI